MPQPILFANQNEWTGFVNSEALKYIRKDNMNINGYICELFARERVAEKTYHLGEENFPVAISSM